MTIIRRDDFNNKLEAFLGKPIVKVITGLRRSGKSFLLKQLISDLPVKGMRYLYIDKESLEFDDIRDYKDLNNFIDENLFNKKAKYYYLFIDEIQEIKEWERCIRSISGANKAEIFITGSNAQLLSSELATFLTGRYINFSLYTLSYKEFLKFRKKKSSDKEFYKYLEYGSLPGIHNFDLRREIIYEYLNSILNTIVLKDVVKRFEVRNVALLEALIKFTFDNIGSTFSAKSISDYLKSQKLSVGVETILNYLSYIESTHLLYKVSRYDIKGKRHLEIYEKYYLADIAFRHALLGFKFDDINDYLENIVFIELYDAAANNTVVECIVRNTPILVNKIPAIIDYLGHDYPLYYNNINEIPKLLTEENIFNAHQYLLNMNKDNLYISYFNKKLFTLLYKLFNN